MDAIVPSRGLLKVASSCISLLLKELECMLCVAADRCWIAHG
jgi:hypothetical protein